MTSGVGERKVFDLRILVVRERLESRIEFGW